ncbi:MAG: transglycosylase SLT domain-containing protein [Acidimicrobiia bacterium]|nr:transglycosylase SLT domain-containing protein [Acidimicrobiia bacterium]
MTCESRGNPDAVNQSSQATGLFQFLPSTWAYSSVAAGFGGYPATHPEANVASAAWLLEHSILIEHRLGPWGPWECNPRLS